MPNIVNLTSLAEAHLPSLTKEAHEVLVVRLAGRFSLPPPETDCTEPLHLVDEQSPPPLEDVYWGDPSESSLRYEGQTSYVRPGTDITLLGHAWSPRGRASSTVRVRVKVGDYVREVQVVGDRVWHRGFIGMRPTKPEPFEKIPLKYENAFGGAEPDRGKKKRSFEPRNPVGKGFFVSPRAAANQPLPNMEDPQHPIEAWSDRPAPAGFGPIARSWEPRSRLAGTYDDDWVEKRAPFWPVDFNERFFHAAPDGLATRQPLRGGEPVELLGCSPDGAIRFVLPNRRFSARSEFVGRIDRRTMLIDSVIFEPDDGVCTVIWRSTIPIAGGVATHRVTTLRELMDWEAFE